MPEPVKLNVYDLTERFKGANGVMKLLGTGVYHCGVELYGQEWSYASHEGDDTGIFPCQPQQGPEMHHFRQAVDMGETELSAQEVSQLLEKIKDEWAGSHYNILQRNCCDFSNEFCKLLGVGAVPGWVKSAAGLGARLDDTVHAQPIRKLLATGKVSRGADEGDGYAFGDFSRGVYSSMTGSAAAVVARGKCSRGGSEEDAYQFGDVCRGLASGIYQGLTSISGEGKRARDADVEDSFSLGDLPRGLVSSLAKK